MSQIQEKAEITGHDTLGLTDWTSPNELGVTISRLYLTSTPKSYLIST